MIPKRGSPRQIAITRAHEGLSTLLSHLRRSYRARLQRLRATDLCSVRGALQRRLLPTSGALSETHRASESTLLVERVVVTRDYDQYCNLTFETHAWPEERAPSTVIT